VSAASWGFLAISVLESERRSLRPAPVSYWPVLMRVQLRVKSRS
jgi:hypothetical protein